MAVVLRTLQIDWEKGNEIMKCSTVIQPTELPRMERPVASPVELVEEPFISS